MAVVVGDAGDKDLVAAEVAARAAAVRGALGRDVDRVARAVCVGAKAERLAGGG